MMACEFGELNIVRELLEALVDVNAVDKVHVLLNSFAAYVADRLLGLPAHPVESSFI